LLVVNMLSFFLLNLMKGIFGSTRKLPESTGGLLVQVKETAGVCCNDEAE